MAALAVLLSSLAITSGLQGTVMRGPTQPVCTVDSPCTERVQHKVLSFVRAGRVYRTSTTVTGHYRVRLAPGRYIVRIPGADFGVKPASVLVVRGKFRTQNIFVDTGIR